MERTSRYILVLVTIITCSIILPEFYWMAFEKPIRKPLVMYSCIDDDFMIMEAGAKRYDANENVLTREEYEQKLPLFYIRQLLVSETMPDSIKGVATDILEFSKARSSFRYKPEYMNTPQPKLYPMFESESGRASLEMPKDFFRITWRMEFINAEENKIDEEKSRMFSAAIYQKGFQFPAKQIAGLPTTRKSCDEGYLIIDVADQLFHVKMIQGRPFVEKVNVPDGLQFKFISCVDQKDKRYYAYLFSKNNEIYILTQDEYELIKWPIEGFNADNCNLRIMGDFFNYTVSIEAEDHVKVYALDKDYKMVDEYNKTWLKRSERPEGKVFATLFPAQLSMTDSNSKFINFYIELSKGYIWLIFNLLLVALHFVLLRKQNARINRQILDLVIVAVTGIFGFIAVNFFPNKFFD